MTSRPQKRSSPNDDDEDIQLPAAKRPRTAASPAAHVDSAPTVSQPASTDELMRSGLRRSIALTLSHVGFDSSSEAALERLTEMTEEYLASLIAGVKSYSQSARRHIPIPTDYDHSLKRFNLGTGQLRPHLKNPIPRSRLTPTYVVPAARADDGATTQLPLLGEELSGRPEKEAKSHIPRSFPDFPSIHTYRATPQDVDEVTVSGSGLKWSDGTPIGGEDAAAEDYWKAGPRGDPRKMREASARESKQAEEALRRVVRASKINQLKEARLAAQRNPASRHRYELWDGLMRSMIEDSPANALGPATATTGAEMGTGNTVLARGDRAGRKVEIADHSMIVNAQKIYQRQEVSRTGQRAAGMVAGESKAIR